MIKAVTVINHLGESLRMELGNPKSTGFLITSITGLGPGSASVNMTESSIKDGATFDSARLPSRNIVFAVEYLWSPTVEASRLKTYKFFPVKKQVTLIFETDSKACYTTGYIESNEPDMFRSNSRGQISIICEDPYFYGYDSEKNTLYNTTVFSSLTPLFEFPFENRYDSATGYTPKLEFGLYSEFTEGHIIYDGNAETGVIISIHFTGTVEGLITIANITNSSQEVMRLDSALVKIAAKGAIQKDDIITINTMTDNKSIYLNRNGINYNILSALDFNGDWINLHTGDNLFIYTAEKGSNYMSISVQNPIKFAGL